MKKHTPMRCQGSNGISRALAPDAVPEWVKQLAESLNSAMFFRAANDTPHTLKPDIVQLNNHLASWPTKEVTVLREQFSSPHRSNQYSDQISKLLTLRSLLEYDTYVQSVARELHTWANTPIINSKELLLDFVAYMGFVFNGPLLSLDNPEASKLNPDIDSILFDPYNIVKGLENNMNDKTAPFIEGTTFNADFLHFLIMNLPVQARVKIKNTLGMELSSADERMAAKNKKVDCSPCKTIASIVNLKEKVLFPYGPWISSTVLIFPGLKNGASLDYKALKNLLAKMLLTPNTPFAGVKRHKAISQPTRLCGTRELMCYLVGRQQWEFTDPEEVKVLFKYFHTDT